MPFRPPILSFANVPLIESFVKGPSVLHIGKYYPPHRGGMETHLRDLAVRQTETARVNVVVSNSAPWQEYSVMDGVSVTRVARLGTIASMPVCPGLMAAIRRSPADLVHIHMPNPGAALAFLMSGHPGKLIITHHADTLGRRTLRRLSDPFVIRLMQRASRILVTSSRYLNSSEELAPFQDKCRIVPLGIDLKSTSHTDRGSVEQLRSQFGDRIILAVGRLVPYKGFDVLIRAMKNVDGKLILIGSGPQSSALARLSASEGVQSKVTMLGHVEELSPYFAAACVFVLPSVTRAEAFGMVQLEAMAAGLPVINTDIDSGVPEVCIHGKTGITVPPTDTLALSHAMALLLDQKELQVQFGEAAKARIAAEYTVDLMAKRTLSVYEDVFGLGH
jgi:glycosyltransferase involved in cell wall biosynthesis